MSNSENKGKEKTQDKVADVKITAKPDYMLITEKDAEGNILNEEQHSYQSVAAEGLAIVRSSRNSAPNIDMKKLKKIVKKHKLNKLVNLEDALKNESFLNDISQYRNQMEEEEQKREEIRKQKPLEVSVVSKILDYDVKCNELIDKCDDVLKRLVAANDACSHKIEHAGLIVEQFNSQREAVQGSETGLVYDKFKSIVDAYQKQAEKAVADARDSLIIIKNLDTVDITAIRKETNNLTRTVEKEAKKNPDFKQVVEKANKLNDIIKIQRKQIESCSQKNETKLRGVKSKLNDYKASYSIVLDGIKTR